MMKIKTILLITALTSLTACSETLSKLEEVGKPPPLKKVENPHTQPDYQPISWPLPQEEPPREEYSNSLWQPGAKAFFRDQRAAKVGDILRVMVKVQDKADINNETKRERTTEENLGAPSVFGLEGRIVDWLPNKQDPGNLLSIDGTTNSDSKGEMKRDETIETQVAAIVTQVLPNGNMVIDGKQQIRVNFEVREITVQGVVRPEDIKADNTIDSAQIAELRVSYGGRGQISDIQQPRWGTQVIDVLSPF